MATPSIVPLDEYLNTSYEPDCDWIEGSLAERNTGLGPHALVLTELIYLLSAYEEKEDLLVLSVIRIKVSESRYRVADLCLIRPSVPLERIIQTAPILCVEVIDPADSLSRMLARVEDYLAMGVETVWFVDPWRRGAHMIDASGTMSRAKKFLTVPGTAISVAVDALFDDLNKLEGVS